MKIKLYKSVALCSLLALAGCHDFEELNTNPYAPIYDPTVENVSADGIDIDYTLTDNAMASLKGMEGAIGSIFANFTYEGPYNDYQTTTNLTHDIYAGYWGNNVSGFVNQAPSVIRIIIIRHSILPAFIMFSCCPCRQILTEIFPSLIM